MPNIDYFKEKQPHINFDTINMRDNSYFNNEIYWETLINKGVKILKKRVQKGIDKNTTLDFFEIEKEMPQVYFIKHGNIVKIGMSSQIGKRMNSIYNDIGNIMHEANTPHHELELLGYGFRKLPVSFLKKIDHQGSFSELYSALGSIKRHIKDEEWSGWRNKGCPLYDKYYKEKYSSFYRDIPEINPKKTNWKKPNETFWKKCKYGSDHCTIDGCHSLESAIGASIHFSVKCAEIIAHRFFYIHKRFGEWFDLVPEIEASIIHKL